MAEYSAPATFTTPGGTILFNRSTDVGFHDPDMCDGLDGPGLRAVWEPKPRTHGVNLYPGLETGFLLVLGGWIRASTATARNAFMESLVTAVRSIEAANGTYIWTPTGSGAKALTVRSDGMLPKSLGRYQKRYQFSLISGTLNP